MWEAISNILTSTNALQTIVSIILIFLILVVMIKTGMIRIKTKHVHVLLWQRLSSSQHNNRTMFLIPHHQNKQNLPCHLCAWFCPDHTLIHEGWFTKCILSDAYDEFVEWITQNHISTDKAYVSTKQNTICALIYSYPVRTEFKTAEFQTRMKNWVEEIIRELVRIRKVYTEQAKESQNPIQSLYAEA